MEDVYKNNNYSDFISCVMLSVYFKGCGYNADDFYSMPLDKLNIFYDLREYYEEQKRKEIEEITKNK